MRNKCETKRVFCTYCKNASHSNRVCRKLTNSMPSLTNSHIPMGYHPTATPPLLPGSTPNLGPQLIAQPQQTGTTNNGLWFQNYPETNQPRTSTTVHTPFMNNMSPASSTNVTEAITQLLTQVVSNKKDDVRKQMMKNIKTFDGTNRTECINWLSQIEATSKFSNSSFCELVCQGMAPSMLHVLSELSPMPTDQEIKDIILANYSDIPSTAKAAVKLQSMQMPPNELLVSFNSRYEAIHRVAFGLSPNEQYDKTAIVRYAKKLPQNTIEKLLQKSAKKDSYIKTLGDAFKQAIEINKESSFVDAAAERYNEQNPMKIDTQINELDDSLQDCDINAMSTRSTNRSADGSFNGSFDRSSSKNSSYNSSYNSRPNFRNNSGYSGSNENNQNRQGHNRDNNRNKGYQQNTWYDQRNNSYQNRHDNNQDRNRFDNRRWPTKYKHYRNQPRTRVIFK